MKKSNIGQVAIRKIEGDNSYDCVDLVSVEEPLEVQISVDIDGVRQPRSIAVTMRTPGNDKELAAGFLFTEGIISSGRDIEAITEIKCNTVTVDIKAGVQIDFALLNRHSFVASSCGVCGKKSIEAVLGRANYQLQSHRMSFSSELISSLPLALRQAQRDFDSTGGIHASALFAMSGELIELREDVGRHNALDKLIGALLLQDRLPLQDAILFLSGRASFELIQKAAHAGFAVVAAVGAPSSLAIDLARKSNMTLIGFVRDQRFNVYCGGERLTSPGPLQTTLEV